VLLAENDIEKGQNVWQAMGGMQVGSIWGHGSYVAPDWTADYLHRESLFVLDRMAETQFGAKYSDLPSESQAMLRDRLVTIMRTNNYDEATKTLTVATFREEAFEDNLKYYSGIFTNGSSEFAIQRDTQSDPEKLRQMTGFFFWTAWASAANRPGETISYTSNFPAEPLVANTPTSSSIVWTGVSVIMLLAGIGAMVWFYAARRHDFPTEAPDQDPLLFETQTPSQRATIKYFVVVAALFLAQIVMGIVVAHYGVEGNGFYGLPLSEWLPYSVARSWHTQLAIFWIATAWLGAGLYIGPIIAGKEPKYQRLGVNILFVALVAVVVGSLAGQWLSIFHKLPGDLWFWFGHQGYEYVDTGRVWQIALLIGLFLWLFLIARTALPAIKEKTGPKSLLLLYMFSTAGIAFFYTPALFWGEHTQLTVVEYWRWWVVHLWVEGFFEVFATVVIAFLFARLKVINVERAAEASLLSAAIYLSGGIIGTLHHLYFAGTPTVALAFGSVFSALEIVPLTLVGYEAMEHYRRTKSADWLAQYKYPIYFFIGVAFWNLVGAGIFGFMINPPIALYYMQGLNTTAVHAHGALFGVYGMLGIGLLLFCLRASRPEPVWKEKLVSFSFWAINIGLILEILLSLLPVGLLQTYQSVSAGYWSARSAEFMQTDLMQTLRWFRVVGDSIFAVGAVALFIFIIGLLTGRSYARVDEPAVDAIPAEAV
jgi:nitric oxide reductase subunit B